jgi:hypothetical protein
MFWGEQILLPIMVLERLDSQCSNNKIILILSLARNAEEKYKKEQVLGTTEFDLLANFEDYHQMDYVSTRKH